MKSVAPIMATKFDGIEKKAKGSAATTVSAESKICTNCKCKKSIVGFFFKKSESRYEAICKACKKIRRKSKLMSVVTGQAHQISSPHRASEIIEPKKTTIPEASAEVDYGFFERAYGKPLSDADRLEVGSLVEFFKILMTESQPKELPNDEDK